MFKDEYPKMKASEHWHSVKTVDMHTGGEPLRVIVEGYPEIKGKTILEKRQYVKENLDDLRKSLMWEPRGHADMYGLLLLPPERPDSDFGVLFMHNEGYSTMCGHATIAIAKLAVEAGWVNKTSPVTTLKIDAPCGQLSAYAKILNRKVENISFDNVPSFVVAFDETGKLRSSRRGFENWLFKENYKLVIQGAQYNLWKR